MSEAVVKLTSDHIKIKGGEYVRDLVRCKECKYYRLPDEYINNIYCKDMRLIPPQPDDYCSYGERKGE